jgi:hypothetical protein
MAEPSSRQLEKHIRKHAVNSSNVAFTKHAQQRMRERKINMPMIFDVLRNGVLRMTPEPDLKYPGVKCRMERFVAGVQAAVVVYVEYPAPELVVVTVIDVNED